MMSKLIDSCNDFGRNVGKIFSLLDFWDELSVCYFPVEKVKKDCMRGHVNRVARCCLSRVRFISVTIVSWVAHCATGHDTLSSRPGHVMWRPRQHNDMSVGRRTWQVRRRRARWRDFTWFRHTLCKMTPFRHYAI